jgi:hypothetical protein
MKKKITNLQLSIIIKTTETRCYWCGQELRECRLCQGSGAIRGESCSTCLGNAWLCPTHEGNWPIS